jgi:hypothetical protein
VVLGEQFHQGYFAPKLKDVLSAALQSQIANGLPFFRSVRGSVRLVFLRNSCPLSVFGHEFY